MSAKGHAAQILKEANYTRASAAGRKAIVEAALSVQSPDPLERERAPLAKRRTLVIEEITRLRAALPGMRPSEARRASEKLAALAHEGAVLDRRLFRVNEKIKFRDRHRTQAQRAADALRWERAFVRAARSQLDPQAFQALCDAADVAVAPEDDDG